MSTLPHNIATEATTVASQVDLDPLDRRLLDEFQHDFPLSPRPYAELAQRLDITESEVLTRLYALQIHGCISRIGPVFRTHAIGDSCLAAMAVPQARLEQVARYINSLDAVNHNYQREHRYNLWFVIAARDQTNIDAAVDRIETVTELSVLRLPMLDIYHIDLGFPMR